MKMLFDTRFQNNTALESGGGIAATSGQLIVIEGAQFGAMWPTSMEEACPYSTTTSQIFHSTISFPRQLLWSKWWRRGIDWVLQLEW